MVDSFRYKKRAIIRHYVFRLPIMPHRLSHWFKEWFNPYKRYQHQRAMHAIRLALAVVSTILIAYLGNIEHGEWIAMTVFVLLGSVPYQGAINSKAYERIIGTLLGMAIGIALRVCAVALPAIVQAVGSQTEVWLDGGIRTGQDILKAWALGARGAFIGRPYLYGLAAYGEAGVTRALEILYNEMDLSMAFTGHRDIQNVTRDILVKGSYPEAA